jgi:predicted Rossmann-fold nucleotide-binding protein
MPAIIPRAGSHSRRISGTGRFIVLRRLPIIGLFGSGTKLTAERAALARDIGILVARLGAHLLTGASYAVTEAAAEGFCSVKRRRGVIIGSISRDATGAFDKANGSADGTPYPNQFIEVAMFTTVAGGGNGSWDNSQRSRVDVLTSNAVIALPGSTGSRSELQMAATCNGEAAKRPEERRTILVGPAEEFAHELRGLFLHRGSVADCEAHLCHVLAAQGFMVDLRF